PYAIPGDYMWISERMTYAVVGQWGILRVLPKGGAAAQKSAEAPVREPENGIGNDRSLAIRTR
ncbi:MAG: hypothetical protein QF609_02645, partial [Gammaproteobacteria bacterium]|nr:hypothetical protein [Gammaproteobacteria bacterium]